MIEIKDIHRLLAPIKNKIFLLIGRAILKAINNSEGTQKIQVVGLSGETITDIERMQEYGFESYPVAESEAVVLYINGNRDQGLAICVHDRSNRPDDLAEGESQMYSKNGNKITMKADGSIEIESNGALILKSGDSSSWKPNIQGTCLFTGAPHGGSGAGIAKLKGG